MKKELVFNYDESMYFGTLQKACAAAMKAGYDFLLFNGIVYFVDLRKTNLHSVDLF